MKKTEHYDLNQWELTDRVLMADFNRDNRLLDAALQGLAADITAGDNAQAAALDAVRQEITRKDSAQSAALAAAKKELNSTINSTKSGLETKISSLDTKQTNALNSAKNTLNSTINSTKSALEAKISSLDTKTANALSAAVALLNTEDQRLDGLKLQCVHKRFTLDTGGKAVTAPFITLTGMLPSQFLIVAFAARNMTGLLCPYAYASSAVCYVEGEASPRSCLLPAGSPPDILVGFPLMSSDTYVTGTGCSGFRSLFRSHGAGIKWSELSKLYLLGQNGAAVTVKNGTLDVYGIRCENFA